MNWFSRIWKSVTETGRKPSPFVEESMNNFTPRAQQALALARQESERFNHNFVGTEHLLLGLIKLGQGVAVNVLAKMGLGLENVRSEIEKQVGRGPGQTIIGNIPYTPRVKKVLALADKERKALNHTYLGTEHILLGLLREGDGVAGRVLKNFDVDIEQTRQEILKELDPNHDAVRRETKPLPVSEAVSVPSDSGKPQAETSARRQVNPVDLTKRYDVYCFERERDVVVYRSALFLGVRKLLPEDRDMLAEFYELEQADGRKVFVATYSVIKFCEPGATLNPEMIPSKQS